MSDFDSERTPMDRLDAALVVLIVSTVLFAALALGAVQAWSEQVVLIGATVIAALTVARNWRDGGSVGAIATAPIVLFVALVFFQAVPLPAGMVGAISPSAVSLRRELLADLPQSDRLLSVTTLSLYLEHGWKDLRMLLSSAAVFFAAASLARRRGARRALLLALCVVGAGVAMIALGHQVLGAQRIWGVVPVPMPPTRSAPFINHSHFSQFMNLSLGMALAVALPAMLEFRRERRPVDLTDWLAGFREGQLWRMGFALLAGSVIAVAMAISGSRGGVISLATAAVMTGIVGAMRPRSSGAGSRWTPLVVLASVAAMALLAVGVSDYAGSRLEQLTDPDSSGDRLTILLGLIPAWKAFPVVGTGLGTFQYVYPMYDQTSAINLFTHAENEFAQVLTETGVIGLALVLWFVVMVWVAYARCVWRGGRGAQVALGLGFGFAAILVHSTVDFGQHLPANAMLTAVACGLLVGMGRRHAVIAPETPDRAVHRGRWFSVGCAAAVFAGLIASIPVADQCRRAETAHRAGKRLADGLALVGWNGSDDEFTRALIAGAKAVNLRPRDAVYRYDLNVLRYFSLARDPSGALPAVDPASTQPLRDDDLAYLARVRGFAARIVDDLNVVRIHAPTFGPAYSMAGQILRQLGDEAWGVALISTAARLTAYDGVTLAFVAEQAMNRGEVEQAKAQFTRASRLLAIDMGQVIRRFVDEYDRPADALELAGDRTDLLRVAIDALGKSGHAELLSEARRRYAAALRAAADAPGAGAGTMREMARVLDEQGDRDSATEFLRRAVFRQPDQPDWRMELARRLAETGQIREAIDHAEAAKRYRPNWTEPDRLLSELRARALDNAPD